jgi:hypothetical protein
MSHIVPIDGPIVALTDDGTSTTTHLNGAMSATVTFRASIFGAVSLRTYVNRALKNEKALKLVGGLSMQSDDFSVSLERNVPVDVACVVEFFHDGVGEGQYGTVTVFFPKETAF